MANFLGIRGYDYIEFYVGTAKIWAFWFSKALGLKVIAYSGPETGEKDKVSYVLEKNDLKFVLSSPVKPNNYDLYHFLQRHGDGVKQWTLNVDSVESAFEYALSNGAIPEIYPRKVEDEFGFVTEAAIKLYDDASIGFINRDNYSGKFKPTFGDPIQSIDIACEETGLFACDHIVGNVRKNEMNLWVNYINKALNFETFVDFGPGDIGTQYSALLSKVVRSSDSVIRNPINEPYKGLRKSQIEEYIQEFVGTGIQHIAIRTGDILKTIRAMRANGVEFLSAPDTYYEVLKTRQIEIDENIDDLKELGILCDIEGRGYLLQIFTKPIGDRPTFFFEIIQRCKGSQGFGKGNFQALFESMEKDQAMRGNL